MDSAVTDEPGAPLPGQGAADATAQNQAPARRHGIKLALIEALFVAAILLVVIPFLLGFFGTQAIKNTTMSAQPGSNVIFPKGTIHIEPLSTPGCEPPECKTLYYNNFTVSGNAAGENVTGSYVSQYRIVFAIFASAQFTEVRHGNSSRLFSESGESEYFRYDKGATVNAHLPNGSYFVLFYYPNDSADNLTVTSPMALGYSAVAGTPTTTVVTPPPNSNQSGASQITATPQLWKITNKAGQVATVTVDPVTSRNETFDETAGSPGWWVSDSNGDHIDRFNIAGRVSRGSSGDIWTFLNLEAAGEGYRCNGTAEGVAKGNFPNATYANGTYSLTCIYPNGTVTGSGPWIGEREG